MKWWVEIDVIGRATIFCECARPDLAFGKAAGGYRVVDPSDRAEIERAIRWLQRELVL